jgi:ABC-type multidrug transport system fused ATPase/permease subunit
MPSLSLSLFRHGPITVIVVMAILAYEIGALTAFTGIMFLLLVFPIQRKIAMMIGGYRRETIKETDKRVNLINEALQAIRAIKFYAWEESIFRRVQEVRAREVDKLLKYLSVNSVLRDLNYVNPAITAMVIFLVYVFLGSYDGSNEKNQLSTGQVLTVLAYLNICRFPLNLLSQSMKAVSDAQVSLTRLTDFFLLPTLKLRIISEGERTKDMGSPMVSLREASFSWTKSSTKGETLSPLIGEAAQTHFSLDNLSFELFPGELIAVIGAVGSGKSTLASAILGEVPLVSGESKVNGRIAFSAQIPWIQNLTVRENILFCSDRDDPSLEARYTASLEQAALLPDLSILPAGDATEIGERGINLSGACLSLSFSFPCPPIPNVTSLRSHRRPEGSSFTLQSPFGSSSL